MVSFLPQRANTGRLRCGVHAPCARESVAAARAVSGIRFACGEMHTQNIVSCEPLARLAAPSQESEGGSGRGAPRLQTGLKQCHCIGSSRLIGKTAIEAVSSMLQRSIGERARLPRDSLPRTYNGMPLPTARLDLQGKARGPLARSWQQQNTNRRDRLFFLTSHSWWPLSMRVCAHCIGAAFASVFVHESRLTELA